MESNPIIQNAISEAHDYNAQDYNGPVMSIKGTRNKTFLLVGITTLISIFTYILCMANIYKTKSIDTTYTLFDFSSICIIILGFQITFKPHLAKTLGMIFAVFEGIFIGSLSLIFEIIFPGIILPTMLLTLFAIVLTLAIYKHDPSIGGRIRKGVCIATLSIALISIMGFIFNLLGIPFILWGNSIIGIIYSIIVVCVATANLIVDYDNVITGSEYRLPKDMEWYFALGLLVTIIWIYVEILKLITKIRSRK